MKINEDYREQIISHLKEYDKLDLIDMTWVGIAVNALEEIDRLAKIVRKEGSTQVTKNGFTSKSGYLQSLETWMKTFNRASEKLGLSPRDREKLKWQKPVEKESII